MSDRGDDSVGKHTSEEPGKAGVVGSVLGSDERTADLEDDELGIPAAQATGGLVPEGAQDPQP